MVSLVVLVYAVLRAGSALGKDGLNPNQGNSEPVIPNQGTDHQRNTDQMIPNQRTDHQANANTMEDNWDGMISPTGNYAPVSVVGSQNGEYFTFYNRTTLGEQIVADYLEDPQQGTGIMVRQVVAYHGEKVKYTPLNLVEFTKTGQLQPSPLYIEKSKGIPGPPPRSIPGSAPDDSADTEPGDGVEFSEDIGLYNMYHPAVGNLERTLRFTTEKPERGSLPVTARITDNGDQKKLHLDIQTISIHTDPKTFEIKFTQHVCTIDIGSSLGSDAKGFINKGDDDQVALGQGTAHAGTLKKWPTGEDSPDQSTAHTGNGDKETVNQVDHDQEITNQEGMDEETSNQYSPDQSTAHTGNHDKETVNLDQQTSDQETSDQETSDQESIDEETTDQESIEDESFERYHVDQNGTVRKWTTTMRTNGFYGREGNVAYVVGFQDGNYFTLYNHEKLKRRTVPDDIRFPKQKPRIMVRQVVAYRGKHPMYDPLMLVEYSQAIHGVGKPILRPLYLVESPDQPEHNPEVDPNPNRGVGADNTRSRSPAEDTGRSLRFTTLKPKGHPSRPVTARITDSLFQCALHLDIPSISAHTDPNTHEIQLKQQVRLIGCLTAYEHERFISNPPRHGKIANTPANMESESDDASEQSDGASEQPQADIDPNQFHLSPRRGFQPYDATLYERSDDESEPPDQIDEQSNDESEHPYQIYNQSDDESMQHISNPQPVRRRAYTNVHDPEENGRVWNERMAN